MVGKTLSHYRIVDELGRGGMGIVYKAEDTKLDRTVAIKVLPPHALTSEDDRARFYREAKAAAQLHHPNIASVFEIDEAVPSDAPHGSGPSPFIAMEFVEGETLAEFIAKGPLTLEDAIRIASQIASGLEAAHEKNIVHRDIKSGNVMLTKKGVAKVLDFGLAQTAQSTKLTRMGSTLGTVAYMSPEQARAQEVDLRTDLWSLGVVLYEMIAGRHPFPGEYEQAVVYSILNQDPDPLTAIRTGVPMPLEWTVNKLLAKSVDERYQSTTDLLVDLKKMELTASSASHVSAGSGSAPVVAYPSSGIASQTIEEKPQKVVKYAVMAAITLLVLFIGGILGSQFKGPIESEPQPVRRLVLQTGAGQDLASPSISPDGRFVAYSIDIRVDETTTTSLNIFDFETGQTHEHPDFDQAGQTSFSPNGAWLVAGWGRSGIVKIRMPDGEPYPLSEKGSHPAWENDSSIIFTLEHALYRMDENGLSPELIVRADSMLGHRRIWCGRGSPINERNYVCTVWGDGVYTANAAVVDLQAGSYRIIIQGAFPTVYVPTGHLVYGRGGDTSADLVVVRFDINTRAPYGPVVPLGIQGQFWRGWAFGHDGTFIYRELASTEGVKLTWLDRTLGEISSGPFTDPKISPDGKNIVYQESDGRSGNMAYLDLETGLVRTLVNDGMAADPSWAPDGQSIVYVARSGAEEIDFRLYRIGIDAGDPIQSIELPHEKVRHPFVSPDNSWIVYNTSNLGQGGHMYMGRILGDSVEQIDSLGPGEPFGFSPDGQYLLSRSEGAIRVTDWRNDRPWPCCEGLWLKELNWMPDDSAILFLDYGGDLYRIPIDTEDTFRFTSEPQRITNVGANSDFTVDPSTGKILIADHMTDQAGWHFVVIQNWFEELKRIAPIDR